MSRPPIRIVSLAPSVTSILCQLGARNHLIGVSRWCKDVAPVASLPAVGDCWKLDVAEVMRLKPTLLIGSVPFAPEAVTQILAQPVAFLAINPRTLADIYNDIRTLGRLASRAARAEKLIATMKRGFAQIEHQAAANSRGPKSGPRVALAKTKKPIIYSEAWPNPRISSPPWVAELIEIAGGKPAIKFGTKVTDEDVARANPDVIVLAWAAAGSKSKPSVAQKVAAWQNVTAIKNYRVHVIRDELLNTPGPPLVHGARELLRLIWQK